MKIVRDSNSDVIDFLKKTTIVQTVAGILEQERHVRVKSLHGSTRGVLLAALWDMGSVPFLVITDDDRQCDDLAHDLEVLVGKNIVSVIHGGSGHGTVSDSGTLQHDEVDALVRLRDSERSIIVISAASLLVKLPSRTEIESTQLVLTRGDTTAFEMFVTSLALNGYERTDYVGKPGEMAVRGGIVDLYPGGWDNPLRIEFWGDTIDSIREFEPLSQRSIREHDRVSIMARVFHDDDPLLTDTILDHVPENAVVVLDGPDAIAGDLHRRDETYNLDVFTEWRRIEFNPIGDADVKVTTTAQPSFGGSVEELLKAASKFHHRGIQLHLGAEGAPNAKRIHDLCENVADQIEDSAGEVTASYHHVIDDIVWHSTALTQGFVWGEIGLAVFAEHQVFGRQRAQRRSRRSESGITMREVHQLSKGDYVVHADKGVGQFDGINTITINESQVDCVRLLFAGGDVLHVHLNYVHKLSKFAGEEGAVPKLSKLGSAEWDRKKSRAKKKIKDIARDLIKLYAQRKSQTGYAFPEDTVWQKEFEASFQYEDTPDQATATAEVKLDMEQPVPMDRLVCGDVGFGKTEVAIRAAFKAAQTGKQVAILVPTTILAQQHFVTFRDRLRRFPITIEVLSRFKSKAEQNEILDRTAKGQVDILIGTHRILSKDVNFRQIGLLVIDEEQRFGVAAKEKLRHLRANVDTLTLTATPIPRTLNFSLMGARDLSIIETPPRNRLPIRTEISVWDDHVLSEAFQRELNRNGQVFVVTDKIHDMDKVLMKLKMIAPTLRFGIAHGQMPTNELEDVMEAFLERKTDVLLATKIIESGLDIPNANTMIILNADNFGLAELYQLRGRVGRSNTQAYCYLVIPPVHALSRLALRRLQALEEFTDLGSGFKLATRDMEIRGAGNLLGGEQSGFILDMGFELYHKILDEAVAELRNEEFADVFAGETGRGPSFVNEDVAIELDQDALLPSTWIPADTDRYDAYKRLYNAHNDDEVDAVFTELRDRFGSIPETAENLWYAVRMRIAALPTGMVRVNLRDTTLLMELPPESNAEYYEKAFPRLLPQITSMSNARFVQHGKKLSIEVLLTKRDDAIPTVLLFTEAVRRSEPLNKESTE